MSDDLTFLDKTLRGLYWGKHRGRYDRTLDKAKSHGTPYVPRHAYGYRPWGGDAA